MDDQTGRDEAAGADAPVDPDIADGPTEHLEPRPDHVAEHAEEHVPEHVRARRPYDVYGVGTDPDYRFSMANERTALAWIRTGLSLVAGGVALTSFATFANLSGVLDVVAGLACLGGALLSLWSLVAWRRNERAMRLGEPLPSPTSLPVLVVGVIAFGLGLCVYAIFEAF